jgi:hypothetical protein
MPTPTDPALPAAEQPAVTPLVRRPVAAPAPAVVSRFGDISPAFAAAFGASVDIGLMLGARNAQMRALAAGARRPREGAHGRHPVLPTEIATARTLPPSRVRAGLVIDPKR